MNIDWSLTWPREKNPYMNKILANNNKILKMSSTNFVCASGLFVREIYFSALMFKDLHICFIKTMTNWSFICLSFKHFNFSKQITNQQFIDNKCTLCELHKKCTCVFQFFVPSVCLHIDFNLIIQYNIS